MLELSHEGKPPCPSVPKLAKAKLAEVHRKLKESLAYRQEVTERIKQWEDVPDGASDAAVCQLIELSKA